MLYEGGMHGQRSKGSADNEILSRISNTVMHHQHWSINRDLDVVGASLPPFVYRMHPRRFLGTARKTSCTVLVFESDRKGLYGCGRRKWRDGYPKPSDQGLSDVQAKFGASGEAS